MPLNEQQQKQLLDFMADLGKRFPNAENEVKFQHPGRLTFSRFDDLLRNPSWWTEEERRHVAGCESCARLVAAFEDRAHPRIGSGEAAPAATPRPSFLGWEWIKGGTVAAAAWATNWLIAARVSAKPIMGTLDQWELYQRWLLMTGLLLGVLVVVTGLVMRWLGWLRIRLESFILGTLITFGVLSMGLWMYADHQRTQFTQELNGLLRKHLWIAYDPSTFVPRINDKEGRWPTEEELAIDLKVLHEKGGFDGLITFGSDGTLQHIPRIAKINKFRAVIMGIYVDRMDSEKTDEQIQNAIAAKPFVDAYCLGHNIRNVDLAVLGRRIADVRTATSKPVTTTFPVIAYAGERGQAVRELADFLFPDFHGSWRNGATPERILEEMRQNMRIIADLPVGKPALLKMISYPAGGSEGLTEANQLRFYQAISREDVGAPAGVYLSFFAAFDRPWTKRDPKTWAPSEEFVGLFKANREPRPALQVFGKR